MELSLFLLFIKVFFLPSPIHGLETTAESDLAELLKRPFFVDKSLLVRDFIHSSDRTILFTAPDGFGKSSNVNLLKRFLEIQTDNQGERIQNQTESSNYNLFKDNSLNIIRDEQFFSNHFGKYPVVYISYRPLRDVNSFQQALRILRKIILKSFLQHKYLLIVKNFWTDDNKISEFKTYVEEKENVQIVPDEIRKSFEYLCSTLQRYFKENVVVLIDDYDAFAQGLIFKNTTELAEILSLIFTTSTFLENTNVHKALLTGVLRLGSGLIPNGTKGLLFLQNHPFSRHFGITEQELDIILKNDNERDNIKNAITDYYGGYAIHNKYINMYNTRSVVSFLNNRHQPFNKYITNRKLFNSMTENEHFKSLCQSTRINYEIKLLLLGYHYYLDISKPLSKRDLIKLNEACTTCRFKDNKHVSLFMYLFYNLGYMVVSIEGADKLNLTNTAFRIPNQDFFAKFTSLLEQS